MTKESGSKSLRSNAQRSVPMLTSFFIWCAGISAEWFSHFPEIARYKYVAIGQTIVLSSLVSGISIGFAATYLFSPVIALIVGINLWFLVFNLNRFTIASLGHLNVLTARDRPVSRLLVAIPRLLISLSVALVTALPIQLKVFEVEIDAYLLEKQTNELSELTSDYPQTAGLIARIDALNQISRDVPVVREIVIILSFLILLVYWAPYIVFLLSSTDEIYLDSQNTALGSRGKRNALP